MASGGPNKKRRAWGFGFSLQSDLSKHQSTNVMKSSLSLLKQKRMKSETLWRNLSSTHLSSRSWGLQETSAPQEHLILLHCFWPNQLWKKQAKCFPLSKRPLQSARPFTLPSAAFKKGLSVPTTKETNSHPLQVRLGEIDTCSKNRWSSPCSCWSPPYHSHLEKVHRAQGHSRICTKVPNLPSHQRSRAFQVEP